MKLPNGERAVVAIEKLRHYCLNPLHPRGRHKARVFATRAGLAGRDAEQLRDLLLAAARQNDAAPAGKDEYGQRYTLDLQVPGQSGPVQVRSLWIVRAGEDFPRLASCYVL